MRVARRLAGHTRVLALTSSAERIEALRTKGIVPLLGNLDMPASLQRLAGLGVEIIGNSPDDFARVIRSDIVKWGKVVKDTGAKAD